ncbi:MAG: hypothetical protein PHC61_09980 [Chitinivibrionales bacterium]|nr:hypothetical protein [Chitinivibrionales bacterium]
MHKLILAAVLSLAFGINAQSSKTIAFLDLENKSNIKDVTMQRVWNRIAKGFSANTEFIVYERWMIDTMLAAQSNTKILECKDEQCLFAIGHLLSVDFVLSGAVSKQKSHYMISLKLVDIKNNIVAGSSETMLNDFFEATLLQTVPGMIKSFVAAINDQENKKTYLKTLLSKEPASQPAAPDKSKEPEQKKETKSFVSKPLFWVSASAVLAGGAAVGVYLLLFKGSQAPNTGISLGDAPNHARTSP